MKKFTCEYDGQVITGVSEKEVMDKIKQHMMDAHPDKMGMSGDEEKMMEDIRMKIEEE